MSTSPTLTEIAVIAGGESPQPAPPFRRKPGPRPRTPALEVLQVNYVTPEGEHRNERYAIARGYREIHVTLSETEGTLAVVGILDNSSFQLAFHKPVLSKPLDTRPAVDSEKADALPAAGRAVRDYILGEALHERAKETLGEEAFDYLTWSILTCDIRQRLLREAGL